MSGPFHRIARWLRLALACLTLAGGALPAHALPDGQPVVSLSVGRRVNPAQRAPAAPFVQARLSPADALRTARREPSSGRIREARSPSPPRRLFLAHRALLR